MSENFPPAVLGPQMAASNFMGAWDVSVLSAGKPLCPSNSRVGEGGFGTFLFWGGQCQFLVSWVRVFFFF